MIARLFAPAPFRLLAALLLSFCVTPELRAQSVTLAWDTSPESDIAGYVVYWGTQTGVYSSSLNVGRVASSQITGLLPGRTYYFTVKAYNTSAFYSPASNEVTYSVQSPVTPPTITSITPGSGPPAGGTSMTITGTNFATGVVVNICGVPATYSMFVHAGAVTALTAPHAEGACTVEVVNTDGQRASRAAGFTYTATPPPAPVNPTLTAIAPVSGPPIGGTLITLTGTNFETGVSVTLGGTPALDVTRVSATTLTALTPSGAPGARAVTVINPSGRTATLSAAFTYIEPNPTDPNDADGDGLPDAWELQYGLDPRSSTGDNGAGGDPDEDGQTNMVEYRAGTHPRGVRAFTRYFAEGADSGFFDTRFSIMNPQGVPAHVRLEFMDQTGEVSSRSLVMSPRSRVTIASKDVPSIMNRSFSAKVEADVEIVADRYMAWGTKHYGSSAETGVRQPGTKWYLAEGATGGNFDLYYLLQNATSERADVEIRYLRGGSLPPLVKLYKVAPFSRETIHVDDEGSGLEWSDVSAEITVTNGVPIIAERSMYVSNPGELYVGGHESAAVEAPATEWFFAEGATGSFWSMYLLLMNPSSTPATVTMTYMLTDGRTVEKKHVVPGNQRYTIGVNGEDERLANAAMSTRVQSTNGVGIVAERAMWWPAGAWYEGTDAFGATSTGTKWGLAEGEQGGPDGNSTYVLVANTSSFAGRIRVTLLFEDRAEASEEFVLDPTSRTNIQFNGMLGASQGRRFSTLIESIGDQKAQIVVERAMYSSADGRLFSNGSGSLGAKLQ